MSNQLHRRQFLSTLAAIPLITPTGIKPPHGPSADRLKTSLNAYSFNDPLTKGEMTIFDMLEFCANAGFDAVDITGY